MKHDKTVLILHGFPNALTPHASPLYQYFYFRQYRIIMPDLFSGECSLKKSSLYASIQKLLDGNDPDVIVGISMGGLIAPFIIRAYPKAKCIFICSGPYLDPDIPFYKKLMRLGSKDGALRLVRLAKKVPHRIYRGIYTMANAKDPSISKSEMIKRADDNLNGFRLLPLSKIKEVLQFVSHVNNTKLLSHLPNKTLLFAGTSDRIMPMRLSQQMNRLMIHSTLIITKKTHYDVFSEKEYHYLDTFIP